jgi:Ca2+/Na+ antiporter
MKRFRWISLAVITFVLSELASRSSGHVEKLYSQGIYPGIATVLSSISHLTRISLDDVLYVLLILLTLTLLLLMIFRKISLKQGTMWSINALAVLYILFYWLWGFNYYRPHLNDRLGIPAEPPSTESFLSAIHQLIDSTNANYVVQQNLSNEIIHQELEKSYQNLSSFLQIKYPLGKRRAKPITFSGLFAKATISGYFGPFFNEIHLNTYLHTLEYPMVLAHEKAHQFGITSEAEANFYAWMVCHQSTHQFIRYSAYLDILVYFLFEARHMETYQELVAQINEPVKEDIRTIFRHWAAFRHPDIEKVATDVNDAYLKANKIEKGVADYDGVVKYITEYLTHKKNLNY